MLRSVKIYILLKGMRGETGMDWMPCFDPWNVCPSRPWKFDLARLDSNPLINDARGFLLLMPAYSDSRLPLCS